MCTRQFPRISPGAIAASAFTSCVEGLRLTHGVLRRVESTIPGFRVQQVDISRGPIERMVGLATLTLSTASSTSDGTLPGIDADRVEDLRRRLLVDLSIDDGV